MFEKRYSVFFSYDFDKKVVEEYDTITDVLVNIGRMAKEHEGDITTVRCGVYDNEEFKIVLLIAQDQGVIEAVKDMSEKAAQRILETIFVSAEEED